jgi:hypothetical protein
MIRWGFGMMMNMSFQDLGWRYFFAEAVQVDVGIGKDF